MSSVIKSARGVVVDFDLLKIKQQIASAPKTNVVQAREDFIDQKFKRRLKRLTTEATDASASLQPIVDPINDLDDADDADDDIQP